MTQQDEKGPGGAFLHIPALTIGTDGF